jgi:hypothetical protein
VSWHGFTEGKAISRVKAVEVCERYIHSGKIRDKIHHMKKLSIIRDCGHEFIVYSPFSTGYGRTPLNPACWRTVDGRPIAPPVSVMRHPRSEASEIIAASAGRTDTEPYEQGKTETKEQTPLTHDDLDKILEDFNPGLVQERMERRIRSIKERQGQSKFRATLLKIYRGRCAFTGVAVEDVLQAAHIIPYKGSLTNNPQNGILLRSDLHILFDLRLITVDDDYTIKVDETLQTTHYARLHGKKMRLPETPAHRPSRLALSWHRKNVGNPNRKQQTITPG